MVDIERKHSMKRLAISLCAALMLTGCAGKDISLEKALSIAENAAQCENNCNIINQQKNDDGFYFEIDKAGESIHVRLDDDGDVEAIEKRQATENTTTNDISSTPNSAQSSTNQQSDGCNYTQQELSVVLPQSILDSLGLSFDTICNLSVTQEEDDGRIYDKIQFHSNQRRYKFELYQNELVEYNCFIANKYYEAGNLSQDEALAIAYEMTQSTQENSKIFEAEYDAVSHEYEFEGNFNGRYASVSVYDNGVLNELEWK